MCGRYTDHLTWEQIHRLYGVSPGADASNLEPRYNIAPTQAARTIRLDGGERRLAMLRWGLVPSWTNGPDPKFANINARAETLEKAAPYRAAFRSRRCLVPASGFYEWRQEGGVKQPYYFHPASDDGLTFAGLWEIWEGGGRIIESFAVVTVPANDRVSAYHDRMPAILTPDRFDLWLLKGDKAALRPCPAEMLSARRVSKRANSPREDDSSLISELR